MIWNPPNLFELPADLAVVPVLVNAGAALLPALFAGLIGAFALLFKPRELFRVCRKKPQIPLIAQALEEDLTVITHDRKFEGYPVKVLWT